MVRSTLGEQCLSKATFRMVRSGYYDPQYVYLRIKFQTQGWIFGGKTDRFYIVCGGLWLHHVGYHYKK